MIDIRDRLVVPPTRTRFFVVHNPNAGRQSRRFYDETLAHLARLGSTLEIIDTTRHGEGRHAAEAAASSGRFDAIVAAGGDGTVHDAAEGVVGQPIPLGIIPTGTANVFAREIDLPGRPDRLARTLIEGEARAIPMGQVNGRPFLFVVGTGFDAEAVRLFERKGARGLGVANLVAPVLHALVSHKDRVLRVQTPRGETLAHWVIVTRIRHYAANLMLAPDADLNRPELHVLCMKGSGALNRILQLSALAVGQFRNAPGVLLQQTNWVRIEGDRDIPVQVDGEMLETLPLNIAIHPKQIRLILPIQRVVRSS